MSLEDLKKRLSAGPGFEPWTGSFAEYVEIVRERPSVADHAHTRLYRAIERYGREGKSWKFFEGQLFGIDDALGQVMDYLAAAAKGLDLRRRMLLLLGPVGTGKSTLSEMLKRALEEYSLTDEGAVYAISGCPLHEEPLHLIPESERPEFERELGVRIEGGLCPQCAYRLENEWRGDVLSVPVERVLLSESRRVGIGSFAPGDPKVVSLEDLVGGMDLVKVSEFGTEAHPLAFSFNGGLEAGSRGLFEAIEIFKWPPDLLFPLLTLLQERKIKAGRFALFYADEAVIGHTNAAEYEKFASDPKNEAIQNRTYVVKVPYILRVSDEVRTYRKLFQPLSGIHVAPHAFETAAYWAVSTRLVEYKDVPPLTKAKLYNGEETGDLTAEAVEEMRRDGRDRGEGMEGIGPRTVVNALSQAAAEADRCLGAIAALRALKQVPEHHVGSLPKGLDKLFQAVLEEYAKRAERDVQKAFSEDFDQAAQTLLQNYMDNAMAAITGTKRRDPVTDLPVDPDETLMRSIEELSGVAETQKESFRREILARVGILAQRGETFRWDSHPRLKEGIEKKLFSDLSGILKVTLTAPTPDSEQRERLEGVKRRLVEKYGYCEVCSGEVMRFVGERLHR